ncbi:MAG: hypothetical protein M1838_002164 [Thelocarpon superellum]|nr:MAG: hypothetical protein M1838_002164 [Thelocarpon superellum]
MVTYNSGTPDYVLSKAEATIKSAGGLVVSSFTLLRGFAAEIPEELIETLQNMGNQFGVTVELDQVVHTNG